MSNAKNKKKTTFVHYSSIAMLFFTLLLICTNLTASEINRDSTYGYRVVHVIDGDTFVASDGNVSFHVRIAGIDAPEKSQDFGKASKLKLEKLVKDKTIQIIPVGKGYDHYGRVLGKVLLGGKEPALILIQEGLATYYRPTCSDYPEGKQKYEYDISPYLSAEAEAKKQKKGIWSKSNLILPCEWRKLGK